MVNKSLPIWRKIRYCLDVGVLFVFLFLWMPAVFAADPFTIPDGFQKVNLTEYTDFLADPKFKYDIQKVQDLSHAAEYQKVETKTISLGVVDTQCWYRFSLRNPSPLPQTVLVEIGNPRMQELTFYTPNADGVYTQLLGGSFTSRKEASIVLGHPTFPMCVEPGKTTTYYLCARHKGSFRFEFILWDPRAYVEHRAITLIFQALLFGMLVVLVLYSVLLFLVTREKEYLHNGLFAGSLLFMEIALRGYGAHYLWPNHPIWADRSILVSEGIAVTCALNFTRIFLQTRQYSRWLDQAFFVLSLGGCVLAVVGLTDWMWTNWLAHILGLITPLFMLVAGCWAWYKRRPGSLYFSAAWSASLISAVVYMLMSMALIPQTVWTEHSMDIGMALGPVFFALALADQFRSIETKYRATLEEKVLERTSELQHALDNVKTLRGLIPICCNCKKIRDDQGYWEQIDVYMKDYMEGDFSHGICPACAKKLYGTAYNSSSEIPRIDE